MNIEKPLRPVIRRNTETKKVSRCGFENEVLNIIKYSIR